MGTILLFFGPVSSTSRTNTPGENIALDIFFSVVLCLVLFEMWRSRRRLQDLRTAARARGWNWLSGELPANFPLAELVDLSNGFVRVDNAFSGQKRGVPFLAFACVFRGSKTHYLVSIIAAKADKNPFGAERFDPDLAVVEADGWFATKRAPQAGNSRLIAEEVLGQIDSI